MVSFSTTKHDAVYSENQQTSALSCATVLNLDFCKVPLQLCDWQHSNP